MTDFGFFVAGRKKGYKQYSNLFCTYVDIEIIKNKRKGKLFHSNQSFADELNKKEYQHLTTLNGTRNFSGKALQNIYSWADAKYKMPILQQHSSKISKWKGKTIGRIGRSDYDFISYKEGDIVKYSDSFYICIESHTSDHLFATNRFKWKTITRAEAIDINKIHAEVAWGELSENNYL